MDWSSRESCVNDSLRLGSLPSASRMSRTCACLVKPPARTALSLRYNFQSFPERSDASSHLELLVSHSQDVASDFILPRNVLFYLSTHAIGKENNTSPIRKNPKGFPPGGAGIAAGYSLQTLRVWACLKHCHF